VSVHEGVIADDVINRTWGRVSRHGVFAFAENPDHIGPMTRFATDAGAILEAISGLDPNDPTTLTTSVPEYHAALDKRIDGLRVGVDASYNEKDVGPQNVAAVREARKVLEDLRGRVKEGRLRGVKLCFLLFQGLRPRSSLFRALSHLTPACTHAISSQGPASIASHVQMVKSSNCAPISARRLGEPPDRRRRFLVEKGGGSESRRNRSNLGVVWPDRSIPGDTPSGSFRRLFA
jgi:Amidase